MDRLLAMKVFVKVAEVQGFAEAGRQMLMSPPAVTRVISQLERAVGVQLLQRNTRSVRATEAGARYLEDCRRILADIDEADAAAGGSHAVPAGTLTVTAPVRFGALHVMPIVTEYLDLYPGVTVQALFLDRIANIAEEGFDVAVRIGHLPDSRLHATQVGGLRQVLCAAPSYLRRAGRPMAPADLARHQLIASVGGWASLEWRFGKDLETIVNTRARLVCNNVASAVAAAVSGWGIARVLSYQIEDELRAGRLEMVLPDPDAAMLPVHVVYGADRRISARTRTFVDLAVERLRGNPAIAAGPRG